MQVLCTRTCADGWWQVLDVTEKYRMPLARCSKSLALAKYQTSIVQRRQHLSIEISQIFSSISYRMINKNERRSIANRAHHRNMDAHSEEIIACSSKPCTPLGVQINFSLHRATSHLLVKPGKVTILCPSFTPLTHPISSQSVADYVDLES